MQKLLGSLVARYQRQPLQVRIQCVFGWMNFRLSSLMFLEAVHSGFDNIPRKQKAFGNFVQAPAALAFADHIPCSPKQQVKNSLKVWDESKLVTRMVLELRGLAILAAED